MDNRHRLERRSIGSTVVRDPLGRSPRDRAPPRFPPEPPSLARATPEGRAAAAQEGSASLWWARVSAHLARWAPWMLSHVLKHRLQTQVWQPWPIAQTSSTQPPVSPPPSSEEGSSHASPSRPLSVGQYDKGPTADRGDASRVEVRDPGDVHAKVFLLIHVTQSKLAVDTALARFGPPHRSSVESSMPDRSVG